MQQRLMWFVMALAAVPPAFGTAFSLSTDDSNFGLLGGTISNTGTSMVVGQVGATTTITGFPPGTASGFVCTEGGGPGCTSGDDSAVTSGYTGFLADYATAQSLTPSSQGFCPTTNCTTATTQTFMGSTGNNVYANSGTVSIATGSSLIFDAQNQPDVVFVIQIAGALTVNGVLNFTLENGALASNIIWVVADAATISVATAPSLGVNLGQIVFDGDILAGTSFTMSASGLTGGSGVLAGTINGCVFSETANTLAGETDVSGCSAAGVSGTPEPGSAELVGVGGLMGAVLLSIRARRKLRA